MIRSILLSLALMASAAHAETVRDAHGVRHGLGLLKTKSHHGNLYFNPAPEYVGDLPDAFDLRALGFVSDIKDQGQCGSCWAHAIVESLEDAILHSGGAKAKLAPQELVDCDNNAAGCGGGNMDDADFIVKTGTANESAYPYKARDQRCKSPLPQPQTKAKSWAYVGGQGRAPTVDEMKRALYTYGSLFVTVAAGGSDWDGRTTMSGCRNRGTNHMVEIVGWTKDGKWIMRNSWGTDWGDKGFAYMPYGCDAIATESESAAYTVFADAPCVPPTVKLPAEIDAAKGTEVMLGVRPQAGVTYAWDDGETDAMIYVTPLQDVVYTLTATNACGKAESSVKVHVLPAFGE